MGVRKCVTLRIFSYVDLGRVIRGLLIVRRHNKGAIT